MTDAEIDASITLYGRELGIPVTDALSRSPDHLVDMVLAAFPKVKARLTAGAQ